MADLLQRGMVWLTNQLQDHASQPVVYVRGELYVELKATLGRTVFALDQEITGVPVEYGEVDFLIRSSDLVLAGQRVEPADHDEIWWTDEGVTRVYEALAPGNEPSWRYADPFRRMFRIHTKFIRTELFAMPGTLQNVTLYRGSETRTIQVDPDLFQATEIDFRQYAGGGFRVPRGKSLERLPVDHLCGHRPGRSLLTDHGERQSVGDGCVRGSIQRIARIQCMALGRSGFIASIAGPLELVLKT